MKVSRTFTAFSLFLLLFCSTAFAADPPYCYSELDGSPTYCLKKLQFPNGSVSLNGNAVAVALGDIACTDCVTLPAETSGAYVTDLVEGTAIDISETADNAENNTATVNFDSTELGTTTFGSGSSIVHTYNASAGTDCSYTYGDGTITTNCSIVSSGAGSSVVFEGATDDAFETTLTVTDPTTSDKTITLPNETGTVCTTGSVCSGYDATTTAGDYITKTGSDFDVDAEAVTFNICWNYPASPVDTDDNKSIWTNRTGKTLTITDLWCESDQTVTMMPQVDDGSAADMDSVDLVCVSTPDTDTALDGDATVADGDRIDIATTSVASTPTWASVCMTGTLSD